MSDTPLISRSPRRPRQARRRRGGSRTLWGVLALALVAIGVLARDWVGPAPVPVPEGPPTGAPRGGPSGRPPARRAPLGSSRLWRWLGIALIVIGTLALADAGVTLVWQEPLTALYTTIQQDELSGALRNAERAPPTPLERRTLAALPDERHRIAFLAGELERHAGNGGAVGRIIIPHIGANFVVVKGTSTDDLKSGPGIYPQTPFPGRGATTAIAGHRTTYLAPFRHIDSLRRGDRILLFMPYARFTYKVIGQRVVSPNNVNAAVAAFGYQRLVLSACTPLFSAEKRLLVYASLVRIVPVGAARRVPGGGEATPIALPFPPRESRRRPSPAVFESLKHDLLSSSVE